MASNKRLIAAGAAAVAAFDPLQNFETVTYTGNGGTQKITGYIRKGAAFNGSSSKVSFTSPIETTNTDFSISLWFNLSAAFSSGNQTILGSDSNVAPPALIRLSYVSTNSYRIIVERGYGSGIYYSSSSGYSASTINPNTWYHLTVTYDASDSSRAIIYLDTTLQNNKNLTSLANETVTTSQALGQYRNNAIQGFNGKIDQVRIFNKALSSSEVTTLYGETYASSTKSTTDIFGDGSGVALYELDEDANDTGVYPYGTGDIDSGQSAVFNGSSSYIDVPTIPNITGSGSDFSFSAWINFDGTSGDRFIMSFRENSYIELGFNSGYSPRKLEFKVNDGSNKTVLVNESAITYNTWHHVCLTAESSGNLTAYLDGVSKGTTAIGSIGNSGHQNTIGAYNAGTVAGHFTGKIDNVRIYSTALSASDVEALVSETNVPTANLVAHYKLDGNANDETTNYNGTASNVTYSDPAEFPNISYNGTPTNVNFLGMAFQPDLVWIKNRTGSADHHSFIDSVRGIGSQVFSNLTNAENTFTNQLTSFDSNGFSIQGFTGAEQGRLVNVSGNDYVAWCWKAGGVPTPNNNTNGTITSTVSANQAAGFSIVSTTSNSSGYLNFGHGLSQAPELVITKFTNQTGEWYTYTSAISNGFDVALKLNSSDAAITSYGTNKWSATSTVVAIGNPQWYMAANVPFIAYCFHSVDGYQKVGSYTGNRPTTVSVTTGFQPRFVMIKCDAAGEDWIIIDSNRGDESIYPNKSAAAEAYTGVSLTSTGFEVHNTGLANTNGATHIYLAIA